MHISIGVKRVQAQRPWASRKPPALDRDPHDFVSYIELAYSQESALSRRLHANSIAGRRTAAGRGFPESRRRQGCRAATATCSAAAAAAAASATRTAAATTSTAATTNHVTARP